MLDIVGKKPVEELQDDKKSTQKDTLKEYVDFLKDSLEVFK